MANSILIVFCLFIYDMPATHLTNIVFYRYRRSILRFICIISDTHVMSVMRVMGVMSVLCILDVLVCINIMSVINVVHVTRVERVIPPTSIKIGSSPQCYACLSCYTCCPHPGKMSPTPTDSI